MRLVTSALLGLALVVPAAAHAGRTAHLYTEEAETVPEGDVELEQWVWVDGRIPSRPGREAIDWVWWGPVVGVTSHLELELPLQLVASGTDGAYLDSIELAARYRLFPREQDNGFQPLIRVGYRHSFTIYAPPAVTYDLVATWGGPTTVRFNINFGGWVGVPAFANSSKDTTWTGTAGMGVSFPLGKELRLAAETYGQASYVGTTIPGPQLYLGPSLEWTRGPFWVTFGSLFGLTNDSSRFLPRVLWAVVL